MDRRKAFGRRLRELRISKGYSQEWLAELAGLHRTYVGDVERGERNISLDNIWRLANALGVNPAIFFQDADNIPDSSSGKDADLEQSI
jgi:transcriptional regulator with XRE-family HTH domain